ncbi:hypothetical protein BJ166DRAFT_585457 [Pestalotiopsis sp. NC0098]|nr:hypothetical protein BJ166DRAFT_585457 [Pestalotiopsis sp. NC0098]
MSHETFFASDIWKRSSIPPLSVGDAANSGPPSLHIMFEDPVRGENEGDQDVGEVDQETDSGYISDSPSGSDDLTVPGTNLARAVYYWILEREELCALPQHIGTHIWLGRTTNFWRGETNLETVIKPLIVQANTANMLLVGFRSSPYCPLMARVEVFEELESIMLSAKNERKLVASIEGASNVIRDVLADWNQGQYKNLEKEAPARLAEIKQRRSELKAALVRVGFASRDSTPTRISDADMMVTAAGVSQAAKESRLDRLPSRLQKLWTKSDKVEDVRPKVLPMVASKVWSAFAGRQGGSNSRPTSAQDATPNDEVVDSPSGVRTVELNEHGQEFLPVPNPAEWYRSSRRRRVGTSYTDPTS